MTKYQFKLIMDDLRRRTKIVGKFKSIESKITGKFNITSNKSAVCCFNLVKDEISFYSKFLNEKDEILNSVEFKCLIDLIKSEHEFKNKKVTMNPEKE